MRTGTVQKQAKKPFQVFLLRNGSKKRALKITVFFVFFPVKGIEIFGLMMVKNVTCLELKEIPTKFF